MDEDRICLVLAKTSELRSRIINCIRQTTVKERGSNREDGDEYGYGTDEEAEGLLCMRDALESLEGQLSSLQALQQQQWYEKEAALADIGYSQRKLLKALKEYKGKDLEVIHEAIAFARETEDHNDLLLPPYPSRPAQSIIPDNGYLSTFNSTRKAPQKGTTTSASKNLPSVANNIHKSDSNQLQPRVGGPFKPVKFLIGAAAKTLLTIVGVITILNLSGFQPSLRKRDDQFKLLDLFQLQSNNGKGNNTIECPPGKIPIVENGEMRCVVKRRVKIPFKSAVAAPDVSYGCG